MVAVVVVAKEVVLAGVSGIFHCLAVALVEQVLVDAPVPQSEAPPEEVVRGVRAQDLRRASSLTLPMGTVMFGTAVWWMTRSFSPAVL